MERMNALSSKARQKKRWGPGVLSVAIPPQVGGNSVGVTTLIFPQLVGAYVSFC